MRLPNEIEESAFLLVAGAVVLYFVGGKLLAAIKAALNIAGGPPQVLTNEIQVPGTGHTVGELRALGWTDAQINTMWGEQVAAGNPELDGGNYGFWIAP